MDITAVMCIAVTMEGKGNTSTKHVNLFRRPDLSGLLKLSFFLFAIYKTTENIKKVDMPQLEAAKRFKFDST